MGAETPRGLPDNLRSFHPREKPGPPSIPDLVSGIARGMVVGGYGALVGIVAREVTKRREPLKEGLVVQFHKKDDIPASENF